MSTKKQNSPDLLPDKAPPGDAEAERLILGALVLGAPIEDVSAVLDPSCFTTESARRIFVCMVGLRDAGTPIDRLTLVSQLQKEGWLESVGGLAGVIALDENIPAVKNLTYWVAIVKEKANLRQLIRSAQRTIDQAMIGLAPAQEIANSAAEALQGIQVGTDTEQCGRTAKDIIESFHDGINVFLDPSLRKRGLRTGYRVLDDMLGGGLQDSELIIIAARPGCGKSALCLNILQYVSMNPNNPQRCDMFSLEMSAEALLTRLLCGEARVDNSKFRAGYVGRDERYALQRALNSIMESPLRIHDEFKRTLPGLVRRIRGAVKLGSKLIAVDHAQLLVTGSRSENRNLEIAEICRTLKLLTLELKIPILLLSQIGRSAEKRVGGNMRPQLADLKESGSLEESADTVMAIHRQELYQKDKEDLKGLADIDILKQRSGETGRVYMRFIGKFIRFEPKEADASYASEENGTSETEPPPYAPTQDAW